MASAEPSAFSLIDLGWDDSRSAEFSPYTSNETSAVTAPARVVRVDKGLCTALSAAGELRAEYGSELPCVGDWIAVRTFTDGRTAVAAVLTRRTAIVRGAVGRESRGGLSGDSTGQTLAANVDIVYIAEPAAPETDLGRIERLLALAWESGAEPVVLITKADLAEDLPGLLESVATATPGARLHAVSSLEGEGLAAVRVRPGQTAVLLGPSGAGKSTLVNALAGADLMTTQQVRAADGRGRHTTTHRELLVLPAGGLIIDTPGLRRVGLYDTDSGLSQAFTDIEELAGDCRFGDCAHESEPGCAVLAAVESGDLPERRLASWRKLVREAAWMASLTDARLRAERTRHWKIIHKEQRRRYRDLQ